MNWHYADNGTQAGPVTDEQLQQLVQAGKIKADTLVWHEGMPDWVPYSQATGNVPPSPGAAGSGEVVCAECGKLFPAGETFRYGNMNVCATCKPVFLQKLSEGAKLNTGTMDYAGFGIRLAAKLVDGVILSIPFLIVYFAVAMPTIMASVRHKDQTPEFSLLPALVQFGFIFVRMGYDVFFIGKYGATPGKMLCKIKVVTSEGEKITYGRAVGRFFAEMLSGLICYIGYFMVLFDQEQRRALHDHICNTRVVHKP